MSRGAKGLTITTQRELRNVFLQLTAHSFVLLRNEIEFEFQIIFPLKSLSKQRYSGFTFEPFSFLRKGKYRIPCDVSESI
jgi:hypothetical protein